MKFPLLIPLPTPPALICLIWLVVYLFRLSLFIYKQNIYKIISTKIRSHYSIACLLKLNMLYVSFISFFSWLYSGVHHTLFKQPPLGGHLSHFQCHLIMYSDAVNIFLHRPLCMFPGILLSRRGTSGSRGLHILNTDKYLEIAL